LGYPDRMSMADPLDWDRIRASFCPESRQAAFDAWKASLRRPLVPPPPVNMLAPIYIYDRTNHELMGIEDSSEQCGVRPGDPPCGGCGSCMLKQTGDQHFRTLTYEEAKSFTPRER